MGDKGNHVSTQDSPATPAAALGERFERVSGEVIAAVEQCSAADWQTLCPAEGRSVAAVAHHIAVGYAAQLKGLRAAMAGRPLPPWYRDHAILDRLNAEHAARHATSSQEEVVGLLRRNGAAVARFVYELSADDLERSVPLPLVGDRPLTVRHWVRHIFIGHPEGHLRSIRAVLSR